jgi:metallo-beta-lactamase class B
LKTSAALLFLTAPLWLMSMPLGAQSPNNWDDPFPPHRIAGNVYYVGSAGLASFLITTPQGHILINSGFERTVPLVRTAVEKLGFKFTDIKILLASQAHDDHIAGAALAKELSGAQVMIMAPDDEVVRAGGKGDFYYTARWKECPVNRVLHDGDEVKLGGAVLVAHLTPGHTKGCTTWTTTVREGGRQYQVVIVGGTNVNTGFRLVNNEKYPGIAEDYARTFRVLKSLACDIFLGAHGEYYGMAAKYEKLRAGDKLAFVDPEGYRSYVAHAEQAYRNELSRQRASR